MLPVPGAPERAFFEELENNGMQTGRFNLPVWEETIDSLHTLINEMFRVTPPTAIVAAEPVYFFAIQQRLLQKGFRIPQDVSMVCSSGDPNFRLLRPSVAHVSGGDAAWVEITVIVRAVVSLRAVSRILFILFLVE